MSQTVNSLLPYAFKACTGTTLCYLYPLSEDDYSSLSQLLILSGTLCNPQANVSFFSYAHIMLLS